MTQDSYQTFARRVVHVMAAERRMLAARTAVIEAKGYRLVGGGQTDNDGGWEITDARTGAVLASGTGGYEEYRAHDLGFDAWHSDQLLDDTLLTAEYEDLGIDGDDAHSIEYLIYRATPATVSWLTGLPLAEIEWVKDRRETELSASFTEDDRRAAEAWLAGILAEFAEALSSRYMA